MKTSLHDIDCKCLHMLVSIISLLLCFLIG
uniref:Uncharacterized protein n=1 Tax=Rhizophora mucronata TaxID=61149 RepID=A0A2P2ITA3_RHIMU